MLRGATPEKRDTIGSPVRAAESGRGPTPRNTTGGSCSAS